MKKLISLILVLVTLLGCFGFAEETQEPFDDRLTIVAMLGDQNRFITVVETALYEKGYLAEEYVDGVFDRRTEMAVVAFQMYKGYEPDGMLTKIQFYWLNRKYYKEWFDSSDIVYITENGSKYHIWECSTLDNSVEIMPISVNIAYELGYDPCGKCLPY